MANSHGCKEAGGQQHDDGGRAIHDRIVGIYSRRRNEVANRGENGPGGHGSRYEAPIQRTGSGQDRDRVQYAVAKATRSDSSTRKQPSSRTGVNPSQTFWWTPRPVPTSAQTFPKCT